MRIGKPNLLIGSDANGDSYQRLLDTLSRLPKGLAGALKGMNDAATALAYKTLKVSDAGIMTNEGQPAFAASITVSQDNVTGDGAGEYQLTGVIWTEIIDKASNFSNGFFTAPIAGQYLFTGLIALDGVLSTHTYGYAALITTGKTYYFHNGSIFGLSGAAAFMIPFSLSVNMSAADTAKLILSVYNGTKVIDVTIQTYFSGHLLS